MEMHHVAMSAVSLRGNCLKQTESGSPGGKVIFEALEIEIRGGKSIFKALKIDFPTRKVIFEALGSTFP